MTDDILDDDGKPVDYEIVVEQVGEKRRTRLLVRCPICRQLVAADTELPADSAADASGLPIFGQRPTSMRPEAGHLADCAASHRVYNNLK